MLYTQLKIHVSVCFRNKTEGMQFVSYHVGREVNTLLILLHDCY